MASLNAQEIEQDLLLYLKPDARADIRAIALQYVLGLTGTTDGQNFIASNEKYLLAISHLLGDQPGISKDAFLALVNLTTVNAISEKILRLDLEPPLIYQLLVYVLKPESLYADAACMVLSNMSRSLICAEKIVDLIITERDVIGFDKIIQAFCLENFNKNANLNYLGPLLSNLSQIKQARQFILDKERCVVQRLLPFMDYKDSLVRRGGIVATIHNCCFDTEFHEWLLSDSVNLLPRLLLPLAGPEEFDEEETSKLPDDLQYLQEDKKREDDPHIRKLLVESIFQLCATKSGRQFIREKNTYLILRELHRWEMDTEASSTELKLIELLISDEPAPEFENLREVQVPKEIDDQLAELDKNERASNQP